MIRVALALALGTVSACAHGDKVGDAPPEALKKPDAPAADAGPDQAQNGEGANEVKVQPSKGFLDGAQIKAAIAPHSAEILACYQSRLKDHPYVSGDVRVEYHVQKTGQVGSALMIQSAVGDWTVEKCVLDIARRITFGKPTGGDGTATFSVPLHFASDQNAAVVAWTEQQIAPVVAQHVAELKACTGAAGGAEVTEVTVTLYVGNRGQVQAVGFASPKPIEDTWADCAAKAVTGWTFTDPLGKIAKASFLHPAPGQ